MKKVSVFLSVVLALLGASTVWSAVSGWEKVLGGNMLCAAVAPDPNPAQPNLVFAGGSAVVDGTAVPGVFRTQDGGTTWTQVADFAAVSLYADPSTPGRVYALPSSDAPRCTAPTTWVPPGRRSAPPSPSERSSPDIRPIPRSSTATTTAPSTAA